MVSSPFVRLDNNGSSLNANVISAMSDTVSLTSHLERVLIETFHCANTLHSNRRTLRLFTAVESISHSLLHLSSLL